MHLKLLLLMGAVLPALAQFESLSTPYDGSRLYFTTRLRQTGTDQPAYGKMFLADGQGVRALMIQNRDWTPFTAWGYEGLGTSNYYDVFGAEISANGTRLAAMARRDCYISDVCAYNDQAMTKVYDERGQEAASFPGSVRLSPNGRWGIVTQRKSGLFPTNSVIDLDTKAQYSIPFFYPVGTYRQNAIANNGTAISAGRELIIFRPPDQSRMMGTKAESAAIDAEGTILVWTDANSSARNLRVVRLTATTEAVSLAVADRDDYAPSISNDGRLILFVSRRIDSNRPQVFVVQPDGGGRRQITNEPEGIASTILSGNGAVAWALTRTGRLLRIDVGSGQSTQVIGSVPAIIGTSDQPASGQDVTVAASVLGTESLTLDVCGVSLPVSKVSDGSVTFRLPFRWAMQPSDVGTSYCSVGLRTTAPVEWEGGTIRLIAPRSQAQFVYRPSTPYSLAAHQYWQALVTTDQPAEPGEIIHLYATGWGTVVPPVPPATVAPSSPLSFLATPIYCYVSDTAGNLGDSVDVLFAGLAPGTIGYYQVSLRLPAALKSAATTIVCMSSQFLSNGTYAVATLPTRANAAP